MVRIANDTKYGLGASIWSNDPATADLISRQLIAGMVYINELVHSEPSMPFGGIKQSGMGKELGEEGIKEFTNQKLIFSNL
jgi:succinate-semialdehyde dehydrogenase/glutarate-semialdehyde dehydrogenase